MAIEVMIVNEDKLRGRYLLEDAHGSQFEFDKDTLENYISAGKVVCTNKTITSDDKDYSRGKKLEAEKRLQPQVENNEKQAVKYTVAVLVIDESTNTVDSAIVYSHLISKSGKMAIKQIRADELKAGLAKDIFINLDATGNMGKPEVLIINKSKLKEYAVLDIKYNKKLTGLSVDKILSSKIIKVEKQEDMLGYKPNIGLNSDIEQVTLIKGIIRTTKNEIICISDKRVQIITNTNALDKIYLGDTEITKYVDINTIKNNLDTAKVRQETYKPESEDDRYIESIVTIKYILGDTYDIKLSLSNESQLSYKLDILKDNITVCNIFTKRAVDKDRCGIMEQSTYALMGLRYDIKEQKFGMLLYVSKSKCDTKSQRILNNTDGIEFLAFDIR